MYCARGAIRLFADVEFGHAGTYVVLRDNTNWTVRVLVSYVNTVLLLTF